MFFPDYRHSFVCLMCINYTCRQFRFTWIKAFQYVRIRKLDLDRQWNNRDRSKNHPLFLSVEFQGTSADLRLLQIKICPDLDRCRTVWLPGWAVEVETVPDPFAPLGPLHPSPSTAGVRCGWVMHALTHSEFTTIVAFALCHLIRIHI